METSTLLMGSRTLRTCSRKPVCESRSSITDNKMLIKNKVKNIVGISMDGHVTNTCQKNGKQL